LKKICIIPARSGSKRIPGKNTKSFLGKPIIAYVIETALQSRAFDEIMVSTDSEKIAETAVKYGAAVPFLRSEKNSGDFASTADVLCEVLEEYQRAGKKFEIACCIYPTSPLITERHLKEAEQKLVKNNFDTVFSVLKFSYPVQRGLKMNGDKIEMLWPENKNKRSQDLEPVYHDAGQFYFFSCDTFLKTKTLFTDNSGCILLSDYEAQDIDNESDWVMAELKYKHLYA
jgi:pseudaminic acid cytidylyltransferase